MHHENYDFRRLSKNYHVLITNRASLKIGFVVDKWKTEAESL
jgi:hypothetical protein